MSKPQQIHAVTEQAPEPKKRAPSSLELGTIVLRARRDLRKLDERQSQLDATHKERSDRIAEERKAIMAELSDEAKQEIADLEKVAAARKQAAE